MKNALRIFAATLLSSALVCLQPYLDLAQQSLFNTSSLSPQAASNPAGDSSTLSQASSKVRVGFDQLDKEMINDKEVVFSTNVITIYNVGPWIKKVGNGKRQVLPRFLVNGVKEKLEQAIKEGKLKGVVVRDFGATDLNIHVTHNYGLNNASVHRLIYDAVMDALRKAKQRNYYQIPQGTKDLFELPFEEQMKLLSVQGQDKRIKERAAESVMIAKGVGVGIGAANAILVHQFLIPGSTPLKKLGLDRTPGFRFIVQKTEDILKGNPNPEEWEFIVSEKALEFDKKTQTYRVKDTEEKNETTWFLALASQPNEYQVVAVYPTEGGSLPADESLVTVVHQPVYESDGKARLGNPTLIYRSQSGADAVGAISNMVHEVHFVPGGQGGRYFVATKAASIEEARQAPTEEGIGYFATYGYQSRQDGVIPPEGILDHIQMNPHPYYFKRTLASKMAKVFATHEFDQPYLSPWAAEAMSEPFRMKHAHLFIAAPKDADPDPVLKDVEEKVKQDKLIAITDDKADMGGKLGHTKVPEMMTAVYRATVMEAIENGDLTDGNTIGFVDRTRIKDVENVGVGDDGHIIMVGDKTTSAMFAHQLSFLAFTRAYLFAGVNRKQYYGEGQDFQGPEAKAAMKNPFFYSKLTPRFFEILRQVMPEIEIKLGTIENVERAWDEWKQSGKSVILAEPFSGNVTQQGIGSARFFLNPRKKRTFVITAADKEGPPAKNRYIREMTFAAVDSGNSSFKNGLVMEIWDVKAFDEEGNIALEDLPPSFDDIKFLQIPDETEKQFVDKIAYVNGHLNPRLPREEKLALAEILKKNGYVPTKRIFLDAVEDREAIIAYLADSDRYNVKFVWGKSRKGWEINNPLKYLDIPMLGASVTRLGILTGGEYVGKDDTVVIVDSELAEYGFDFIEKKPWIVQGDMNGSHWEWIFPSGLEYAVATERSLPIVVGVRYTLSEDGKSLVKVEDILGQKRFDATRRKISEFNWFFNVLTLGQLEPHGANVKSVEAAYALARIIAALNADDSPFKVKNRKDRKGNPVQPLGNPARFIYRVVPTIGESLIPKIIEKAL